MEKEQIIKALECCTRGRKINEDIPCLECPYNECNIVGGTSERQTSGTCQGWLMKDALALIKELAEENERLKEKADRHLDNLKAVLEERSENTIVADTVRKFAERLKAICWGEIISPSTIDRIAEEILEGEME